MIVSNNLATMMMMMMKSCNHTKLLMKTYYLQLDFSSIYSLFVVWPLKRGLFLVVQRSVKILTVALDNHLASGSRQLQPES